MLNSKSVTAYTITCDICGKEVTVTDVKDISSQPFAINTVTNDCICTDCINSIKNKLKQEAEEKAKSVVEEKEKQLPVSSIFDNLVYYTETHPLLEVVEHIRDERKKDMIEMRLNGYTLKDIAQKYAVSRENVRQLTSRIFSKFTAEEDLLDAKYYFEKYEFLTKENLIEVFGITEQIYNYYKCKYDRNHTTTEDDLFNDPNLTEELKEAFDKALLYSIDAKNNKWHEQAMIRNAHLFEGNPWGQLTVIDIAREYNEKRKTWLYKAICKCSCGNYTTVAINMLPRTKSCGCAQKKIREWIKSPDKRPTMPCKCVETGIIYESITKASKETGISSGSIAQCCKNPTYTAHGYHWEYADSKYGRDHYECRGTKKVECIETGEIFNSVNEARRKYPSVANTLYGVVKNTEGYHFRFVE